LLAQRLTRRGVTLSGGALAMALAKASASVPASLVGMTTKAALLVAVGCTAALSPSLSDIFNGVTKAMVFAKLRATLTTVMGLLVCAGTVVYCANGQTASTSKPQTALEALRHENELLNINLRVTLEKIKTLEAEVGKLKSYATVGRPSSGARQSIGLGAAFADLDGDGFPDIIVGKEGALFKNKGDGTFIDVTAGRKKATKVGPEDMESALKLLRAANDAESRRRAVDKMEEVMKKLRDEVRSQK
jgi:hypothetical protein